MSRELVSGWQNVRKLMLTGWQLGLSSGGGGSGGWWIQKGGLGKGGEAKSVHAATAHKMRRENLITAANTKNTPWYRTDYILTEANK